MQKITVSIAATLGVLVWTSAAPAQQAPMSFFVTSAGLGKGGDLGCQIDHGPRTDLRADGQGVNSFEMLARRIGVRPLPFLFALEVQTVVVIWHKCKSRVFAVARAERMMALLVASEIGTGLPKLANVGLAFGASRQQQRTQACMLQIGQTVVHVKRCRVDDAWSGADRVQLAPGEAVR